MKTSSILQLIALIILAISTLYPLQAYGFLPGIPSLPGLPGAGQDLAEDALFDNDEDAPPPVDNNIDGRAFCDPDPDSDNHVCNPEQTCQKRFRNILPNSGANPFLNTENTEQGEEGEEQPTNPGQGGEIEPVYECVAPPNIPGMERSRYYSGTQDGYNQSQPNLNDPGVPVNIINQGPVPVDLFNYPNPINTNVVSPNPMPVRVIDDLPMYHQTRIDEAQAAIQQARTTQQTANSVMRTVNQNNLAVRNPEEIRQENVETVIEDPTTGLKATAQSEHGNNPEMDFTELDTMFGNFKSEQNPTHLSSRTTNDVCGDAVTREEASEVGLSCALSFLEPQNRPDGQKYEIWQKANENFEIAQEHTGSMIENGYYPVTEDGDRNPFTAQIKTPASTVSETVDQTVNASLSQVLNESGAAGDACWGRLPGQAIDGTLNPVLRDGILKDLENFDTDGANTDQELAAADQVIQNDLAQNLVAGANCEVSRTVDNILAGTPFSFDLDSGIVGFSENINLWGFDISAEGEFNARPGTLDGFGLSNDDVGSISINDNGDIVTEEGGTFSDVDELIGELGGPDEQPQAGDFLEADEFEFGDENELDL